MKKMILVYNPVSGDSAFKQELDLVIDIFQEKEYVVELYRTSKDRDIQKYFKNPMNDKDIIVVAGGDGTVNSVVNAMMKEKINVPLGIIPAGTANDLATYLGMPKGIKECCKIILENNIIKMDVGKVNEGYFISVVSGGLLASVSQSTDVKIKNTLGKLAYYLKGLEEIPSFKTIDIVLESPDYKHSGKLLFFLVLNSKFAGGFRKIAPKAEINDGNFDVILFKNSTLPTLAKLFLQVLKGEHIYDPNVVFFQTNELKIQPLADGENIIASDVDGEIGPAFPLEIYNVKEALNIIVPKDKKEELLKDSLK